MNLGHQITDQRSRDSERAPVDRQIDRSPSNSRSKERANKSAQGMQTTDEQIARVG